jgi:subtilisin
MTIRSLLAGLLIVCLAVLAVEKQTIAQGQGTVGRYIVVLQDDQPNVPAVAQDHAARFGANVQFVYQAALRGYAAAIPDARLAALRSDPRVLFVSEDRPVSAVAQSLPTGIDRIDAEAGSLVGTALVPTNWSATATVTSVAVIDTGSGPHADLNVVGGYNCSTGQSYADGNGHGSHVAGTIGAKNDTTGVQGVAPGIPIYSVRVLNNAGSGSWSSVVCGINWVTANAAARNIRVANMSLGGTGVDDGNCGNTNNDALHKAICGAVAAGVTYIVAAGNDGINEAGAVPAAYNEVLTVTAVADFNGRSGGGAAATCRSDVDDTAADFSNFTTPNSPDAAHTIAAPGVCILSTWKNGGYNTISGTSMATPHVTGTAAVCIATGACNAGDPLGVINKLRYDAAQTSAGYGFVGDPAHLITTKSGTLYYGYLATRY